jgi:hypothetical protein
VRQTLKEKSQVSLILSSLEYIIVKHFMCIEMLSHIFARISKSKEYMQTNRSGKSSKANKLTVSDINYSVLFSEKV